MLPAHAVRYRSLMMGLFIGTQALFLAVCLVIFFALPLRWWAPAAEPSVAGLMLAPLVFSSLVLRWGAGAARRGALRPARMTLMVTGLLGIAYLYLQAVAHHQTYPGTMPDESRWWLLELISGVHGAQVTLGLLMLTYALLPGWVTARSDYPPETPLLEASSYWYFVTVVGVIVTAVPYLPVTL